MPFKKGETPPGAKPWIKGESGNLNGRPKKLATRLKEIGYTKAEVGDTINAMLAMNLDELKQLFDNKNCTVLEKTIANALMTSLRKGSVYTIDSLLDRTHGKATEKLNFEGDGKMLIKVEYADRSKGSIE